MRMIIINEGSSSIKYTLLTEKKALRKEKNNLKSEREYAKAIDGIIEEMHKNNIRVAVHRIVHGYGQKKTSYYNASIRRKILSAAKIAPLHSKHEIMTLERLKAEGIRQVCVFDSLPYDNLPEYPLPKALIRKHNIHRFGFHGLSHLSMRNSAKEKRIITCHLGSGSSITGWIGKKTVYHSMGFSPNEGMVMMTRTGTIDPGIITFLMRQGHDASSIDDIMNKESGMMALCGNNDFKTIISRMKRGNDYEKAYNAFVSSAAEHILRATVYTGMPERIIFAGAIGESSKRTVRDIMKKTLLKARHNSHKTDEEKIMIIEALSLIGHSAV